MKDSLFDKKTRELISKSRTLTIAIWSASLVLSVALYFLSIHLQSKALPYSYVQRIAEILFGAALIGLIFSRLQEQQNLTYVREVISYSMGEIFNPILNKTYNDFLKNYRWTCHLTESDIRKIQGAVRQNMIISYTLPKCPNEICIVYGVSDNDRSMQEFYDDKKYVLRWGIAQSVNYNIKPDDTDFFSIPKLRLDGTSLNSKNQPTTIRKAIPGGEAIIYKFDVPQSKRNKEIDLTIGFSVLKIIGDDSSFDVNSRFFKDVTDAEINLFVDSKLNIKKINTSSGNITKFLSNDNRTPESGLTIVKNQYLSSYLFLRFPILKGSSFRFTCTKI
ncbi:hypothetical protein M3P19_05105 [Muricauda sp. 2012CJ35-5]|uniref:SMODS-associating 2TM beta-strand rich effector domain-containing protein n=1 Tax=Flagellimonas spongiicola TaxID=2942208 RepID=A0ABT0PQ15_9FLAO|nr:hypothetical protein [Allomuricauda spongiicola]MCL6273376.1 hypothetical protein [Allomuricauda spongiicola]